MTNAKLVLGLTTCGVCALLLFSPYLGLSGSFFNSSAQTGNLSVSSETMSGTPLTGYWVEVTNTAGATVASGFTPASFSLPPGNYLVGAGNYGSEYFSQWSDGTTSAFYPVTITDGGSVSLMSMYCSSPGCAETSSITVSSGYSPNSSLVGMYVILEQSGQILATGFTPVTFAVSGNATYSIVAEDYTNAYFYQWSDGVCSSSRSVTVNSSDSQISLNALYTTTSQTPSSCGSSSGITIYAARIPASYWAPCFALTCSAGTGPGAAMWFVLYDSSGNVIATAFSNENGYTFTGLTPGATYYVYPADCDLCHGSTHDVLFEYWNNDTSTVRPLAVTVGESLTAWYSCTNNCSGG